MTYSSVGLNGDKNAHLLFHLVKTHGAIGLGAISGFFEVDETWICPVCHRDKEKIARIDKNGNLFCQMVWHHDHLIDMTDNRFPIGRDLEWLEQAELFSLRNNFVRFQDILICGDCNVVEGDAKKKAGTPADFSFTPFEISTFIIVEPHRKHLLDIEKLKKVYDKIKPSLGIYGDTLRDVAKHQADPDGFEQIGGSAWRVLKEINRKRKEKNNG